MSSLEKKVILITGGSGYVGTHTVLEFLQQGIYQVIILDNGASSSMEGVRRVEQMTGQTVAKYQVDLVNKAAIQEVFTKHKIHCVIHMAGVRGVGASRKRPFFYYKTNLFSAINLIEVMQDNDVYNLIFSSSATVYGPPKVLPLVETLETGGCTNPYGRTKFFIENIFRDICTVDPRWNMMILRYFNPVGAHESGTIGENPMGTPNHVMAYVAQVAVGRRKELEVFGNDFDTPDGTALRDYVHVVDLAKGHLAAMRKLEEKGGEQPKIYNLGTGKGISVLEIISAFHEHSGQKIPYRMVGRREGDVPTLIADASKALRELGWKAERGLEEICSTVWNFQSKNPNGYQGNPDTK